MPPSAAAAASERQWSREQWAALSPEQRDQMRNQVREHWRQMSPEDRQRLRDEYQAQGAERGAPEGGRQQRMSPDQRDEFRQWMRDRRGQERGGPPG